MHGISNSHKRIRQFVGCCRLIAQGEQATRSSRVCCTASHLPGKAQHIFFSSFRHSRHCGTVSRFGPCWRESPRWHAEVAGGLRACHAVAR